MSPCLRKDKKEANKNIITWQSGILSLVYFSSNLALKNCKNKQRFFLRNLVKKTPIQGKKSDIIRRIYRKRKVHRSICVLCSCVSKQGSEAKCQENGFSNSSLESFLPPLSAIPSSPPPFLCDSPSTTQPLSIHSCHTWGSMILQALHVGGTQNCSCLHTWLGPRLWEQQPKAEHSPIKARSAVYIRKKHIPWLKIS